MSDQPPVPDDSLSSLFENGSWLFPRAWSGFALIFCVTVLPMEILSALGNRALGLESTAAIAQASRDGALDRVLLSFALKLMYALVALFDSYACIAMGEALARGEAMSAGDALRSALARLPAQLWTTFNFMVRLLPVGLLTGIAAALAYRDSLPTAIVAGVLGGGVYAYFTLRWIFSALVTQLEGLSGGAALRRSSSLSAGRFWLVSFQFLGYNAVVIVPSVILGYALASGMPEWAAGMTSAAFGSLAIAPFTTGIFLALYRREAARDAATAQAPAA